MSYWSIGLFVANRDSDCVCY